MDVHRAPRERAHVRRREDPHPSRVTDEADLARLELLHQRGVVALAVRVVLRIHPERLDARGARAVQRRRALAIADDDDHARGKFRRARRVEQRLQIRSASGGENGDAQRPRADLGARGVHTRSTPRSPATISPMGRTVSPAAVSTAVARSAALGATMTT